MSRTKLVLAVAAAAMGLSAVSLVSASHQHMEAAAGAKSNPAADKKIIDSAMKAAPASVGAKATIIESNADGSMRTVREGSNGFTCMADNPATPGPDPMCMDQAAMEFVGALVGHKDPPTGKIGFMYMLSGGTDASNTDPYATAPSANNHWIKTGPHIMIVGADASFYAMYPNKEDPDTSAPYVMWPGSKYQHLMVPVK
jgi:hypothetical protein